MPLSSGDKAKIGVLVDSFLGGGEDFTLDEIDLAKKATFGDLIAEFGLDVNKATRFENMLTVSSRKHTALGLRANVVSESRVLEMVRNEVAKAKSSPFLSEGMAYHVNNRIPITDNVYRPGTKKFFDIVNEARALYNVGLYEAIGDEREILEGDLGTYGNFHGHIVPLDYPMLGEGIDPIAEAKYKGRDVKLGAGGAKRSGGRAHVYVRDPKSGKVKKISFGSGAPDAMGDSEAHRKRRKSFGARHKCSSNKNKMSASYWACRATKMFGRKISGWW